MRHIKSTASIFSSDCQPSFADYGKERIALTDLLVYHRRKIVAAPDRVEVHVYVLSAEVNTEDVEQPTRIPAAIFMPIADEYSRQTSPRAEG